MKKSFNQALKGYQSFRKKYAKGDNSLMHALSCNGQQPEIMVVACSDSRVDPALILQCEPGDLFVIRNVANIVPPFEENGGYHGVSAALEFGICFLKVKHLILLGHSQCGGVQALLNKEFKSDFIGKWISLIKPETGHTNDADLLSKMAIQQSYDNSLSFPWIKQAIEAQKLSLHRWWFDIKTGQIMSFDSQKNTYIPLAEEA